MYASLFSNLKVTTQGEITNLEILRKCENFLRIFPKKEVLRTKFRTLENLAVFRSSCQTKTLVHL